MTVLAVFFFFNDTATTEIYTLSLHDALPICQMSFSSSESVENAFSVIPAERSESRDRSLRADMRDRKSTRLNSSHSQISYAVFCLKKKRNAAAGRDSARSSIRFGCALYGPSN